MCGPAALYKETEWDFPLELGSQLSLEQCKALIPDGPGGWRKVRTLQPPVT